MTENPYWAEREADKPVTLREKVEEAIWNPMDDAHIATFKDIKRRDADAGSHHFGKHASGIMQVELAATRIMAAIEEEAAGETPAPRP